jgi:predicted secreted hydrolase
VKDDNGPVDGSDEALSRRSFLSAAGAASIAGVLVSPAEAAVGKATKPAAKARSGKIDPRNFTGPGIEAESGTAIYRLPRDHAMHGGKWYHGAEYQETNYFTGFFTDRKTNKPYSLFFCWSVYGWDAKLGRPLWVALFALTDIERKKFVQAVHVMRGELTTAGSGANVPDKEFFTEYLLGKAADQSEGAFSYRHEGEAWRFMSSVPTPSPQMPGDNKPYFMDVRAKVAKPGYQCPVPYGFTQEGAGTDVTNNLANPFTGASLSWYVIAPCMEMTAKLKCDDMDLDLVGQAYYEHQWGRIRIPGMEQARYFWGWARLDDGRILNWRTYRDAKTGKYVPEDSANRFNVVNPDGRMQYFMGPAFVYEPKKMWKSPFTGVEYPVYGLMTTPVGKFYCEPVADNAEAQLLNGGMWEGAVRLRKDGPDGPVIGRSFCEHMWAPFDSAVGKDIPYDPKITGRRDGHMIEQSDYRRYTSW